MKIVFHERYREVYSADPAATQGRLDRAYEVLKPEYEFVEPDYASEQDIQLMHTDAHIDRIKQKKQLFELSLLAAGGAIKASELALAKEPAFGLIRPPGHHASKNSCWGFCWFNNIAVAIEKLKNENKIDNALIIDFDLHFGDGTNGMFKQDERVSYYHMGTLEDLEKTLEQQDSCDIIGISAGFDRHLDDWGGILSTQDYQEIGKMIKEFSLNSCPGKIFAVLEGGYNHDMLGPNIKALLQGLK